MERVDTAVTVPKVRRRRHSPDAAADGFPGCRAVRISRDEIVDYDGRIEFWDAGQETAYVAEPTSHYHEGPAWRLGALVEYIAAARGSSIICYGNADLVLRDAKGERSRILQADNAIYLHPERDAPKGESLEAAERLPDVVLEVDLTTNVYRRKLSLYEQMGVGELWVEVPDAAMRRPRSRAPGLAIHVLGKNGRYRHADASVAFVGWTAEEIHAALYEPELTPATAAVLWRIGRALGAREGTAPQDNEFLRTGIKEGWCEGLAEGRQRGREEGREEGRKEGREEGRKEGREEGRQQGRHEGRREGQREGRRQVEAEVLSAASEVLRAQAQRRFGADAAARVDAWLPTVSDVAAVLGAVDRAGAARNEAEFLRTLA